MAYAGEIQSADGSGVGVEIADGGDGGIDRVGRAVSPARAASETLQDAMAHVRPAPDVIAAGLRDMAHVPDAVRVDFGIKLTAETGGVVAKAAPEADYTVSVEWQPRTERSSERQPPAGAPGTASGPA
ncbi:MULTISPECIES: CU044_2847 family protein [unclassified Streptomyces]|uniref:CU044_2847 family protein n=1 Tax=unclassified Streptomyces TaxID=2593676 RepID=UPI0033B1921A